jgi:serine/threonine protein kinase
MSPEQALMRSVDARSDIFSFGCVLYQMATGQPPFKGASDTEVLDAILHRDPVAFSRVRPDAPPELDRIVEKALRKDPNERYQHMSDLVADLRHLRRESSSASAVVPRARTVARTEGRRRGRLALRIALASAPFLVAAVVAALWMSSRQPALSFAARDWILVADFDNQTGQPVFDRSLLTALTVSLEQSAHANVFPRTRVSNTLTRMKRDPASDRPSSAGDSPPREHPRTHHLQHRTCRTPLLAFGRIVDPQTGETVRSTKNGLRGTATLPALGFWPRRSDGLVSASLRLTAPTSRSLRSRRRRSAHSRCTPKASICGARVSAMRP